jgi:hypothetical protein
MASYPSIQLKNGFYIRKFEDIAVSTRTSIGMTNLTIDLPKLYSSLPITEYIVVPKKRGRKKKNVVIDPNKDIPSGSIITLEYKNKIRGVRLKKKKKSTAKEGEQYFRNSVTIVMIIDDSNGNKKKINCKGSANGKWQFTGCKTITQPEDFIKIIWYYINDSDIYSLPDNQPLKSLFIPAMRNIDFSLGFCVNREKIDKFFNTNTKYSSLLEPSIGYTGVNIKIPFQKPITELNIKQLIMKPNNIEWGTPTYVTYNEHLEYLKPKEREKKLKKQRYHTFLVFYSGKIIMSSICEEFAKDIYYDFMNIIKNNYHQFIEKLEKD